MQAAVERRAARAHAGQAEWPARARAAARQADAVVADDERQVTAVGFDPHIRGFGRPRVLGDIVQRFLRDAEHGERGVSGQAREAHVGGADEARAQLRARGEIAVHCESAPTMPPSSDRRMQVGNRPAGGLARRVERAVWRL